MQNNKIIKMRQCPILLTTINARYTHTSLALRYLKANLQEMQDECEILEFNIIQGPMDMAQSLLELNPKIIAMSVYIWNYQLFLEVAKILKKVAPHMILILGGPEVSYDFKEDPLVELADYLIVGEGEISFYKLLLNLLNNNIENKFLPKVIPKVIVAETVNLDNIKMPYHLYSEEDIAHKILYVEASRGCPFTCSFCLSSISKCVREFSISKFLQEMEILWQRGGRTFKFIDRTFNLIYKNSEIILQFFLDKALKEGELQSSKKNFFIHFEVVPDRFPTSLREILTKFPKNVLQLEIGVQSLNKEALQNINRSCNIEKALENLKFLRENTNALLHLDLIVGLPGEEERSFARGFNEMIKINPQEIQVGFLKQLRGAPLCSYESKDKDNFNFNFNFKLLFHSIPPYEIIQNSQLTFLDLQRIKKFARYFEIYYNQGKMRRSLSFLLKNTSSAYDSFMLFSNFIYARLKRTYQINFEEQLLILYDYYNLLIKESNCTNENNENKFFPKKNSLDISEIKQNMRDDLLEHKIKRLPLFLRD
ncbi:MAG: DUF4080 domain-containing protein [Oligoflexia bacterium]|nr:DUF4080 domain-containing protein [Oligoflexia bacterium]